MKKNVFPFLLLLPLLSLLSGCELSSEASPIIKVRDTDKLYLGSYPTVRDSDNNRYDNYLYFSFTKEGNDSFSNPDVSVNLNVDQNLITFGYGDDAARLLDICSVYSDRYHGQKLSDYFLDGGMVEYWIGYDNRAGFGPVLSSKNYLLQTGKAVALSSVTQSGEMPAKSESDIYKDKIEWRFWKW